MNKVLASVSVLVDTQHRVVIDKDAKTGFDTSFITNKCAKRRHGFIFDIISKSSTASISSWKRKLRGD